MSHVISNAQAGKEKKMKKKNSFSKSSVFKKDGLLNAERPRSIAFLISSYFF